MPNRKRKPGKILEGVPTYAVPDVLFDSFGDLTLKGADLSVYLYCCRLAVGDGKFLLDLNEAEEKTGYKERQIWRALRRLQGNRDAGTSSNSAQKTRPQSKQAPLIVKINGGNFLPDTYSICTEGGIPIGHYRTENKETLRGLLYANHLGYFDLPSYLMERLNELKGAPLSVVLTGIKQADIEESAKFVASLKEWKRMARITKDSALHAAWECETVHALMHVSYRKGARRAEVELFDPVRYRTLAHNMAEAMDRAAERKAISVWEADRTREFTQEELERWFMDEFPEAEKRSDGELYVECPQCHGLRYGKRTPTLRFNFGIGQLGVMSCHAFIKKDSRSGDDLTCTYVTKGKMPYHFVAETKGISAKQALQRMRSFISAIRGELVEIETEGESSTKLPGSETSM